MQELFHFQAIRRNSYSIFTTLVHIRHTQYTVVLLHGSVQIAVPLFSRFGGAPRVEKEAEGRGSAIEMVKRPTRPSVASISVVRAASRDMWMYDLL